MSDEIEKLREELAEANARRADLRTALEWANEERDRLREQRDELERWKGEHQYSVGLSMALEQRDEARAEVATAARYCDELAETIRMHIAREIELEAAWRNERATFASCNRARQHCERECEDLRKRVAELEARTTYAAGEIEWANRIAHAEARFVEEYDMRKAAERQVEELKARIVTLEAMKP